MTHTFGNEEKKKSKPDGLRSEGVKRNYRLGEVGVGARRRTAETEKCKRGRSR